MRVQSLWVSVESLWLDSVLVADRSALDVVGDEVEHPCLIDRQCHQAIEFFAAGIEAEDA